MSSQPATLCVTFSVISSVFAARKALSKLLDGLAPFNLASDDTESIKMVLCRGAQQYCRTRLPQPINSRANWRAMHIGRQWVGHCTDRYWPTDAKRRATYRQRT